MEGVFNRLREGIAPVRSGNRALCSNHWVILQELWDKSLERKVDSEVRCQVIVVQTRMKVLISF